MLLASPSPPLTHSWPPPFSPRPRPVAHPRSAAVAASAAAPFLSPSRSLHRGSPGSFDRLPGLTRCGIVTMTSRVALKVAMRAAGNSPGAAGALGASLSGRGSLWAPMAPAMASVGAPRGQSSPTAVAMEEQVRWVNLKVVRERMKTVSNIGKVRWGRRTGDASPILAALLCFRGEWIVSAAGGALGALAPHVPPVSCVTTAAVVLFLCGGIPGERRLYSSSV